MANEAKDIGDCSDGHFLPDERKPLRPDAKVRWNLVSVLFSAGTPAVLYCTSVEFMDSHLSYLNGKRSTLIKMQRYSDSSLKFWSSSTNTGS